MIDSLGQQVGALDFVSHCYHRPRHLPEWSYNLFAMLHGKTQASVDSEITQIKTLLGEHCHAHTVLYSTRILKKRAYTSKDNMFRLSQFMQELIVVTPLNLKQNF